MLSNEQNFSFLPATKPLRKFAGKAILPFYSVRMRVGSRLLQARKKKGISQEELAKHLGTKGPAIGRYERNEMNPSIEAATKMAQILEVSLDWLVGATDAELDTATIHRIQDISRLSQKDKDLVFEFLDSFISNRKIKNALG